MVPVCPHSRLDSTTFIFSLYLLFSGSNGKKDVSNYSTFTYSIRYPTAPGTSYPHNSLTCNVVNENQMLVMGGTFPNSTQCDAPTVYGFHNLDLSENNSDDAKWFSFNYSKQGYQVPPEIISVVGGK